MKKILLSLFLLAGIVSASGQTILSKDKLLSALDTYIRDNYSDSWEYSRPAFALVIDCSSTDTVFFSLSNVLQQWKFDLLLARYYLECDSNTILIRLSNCKKNKPDFLIPLSNKKEKEIKDKLVPDALQVSSLMNIQVFYCVANKMPVLIHTYIDNIDVRYLNLFPFPDAISSYPK